MRVQGKAGQMARRQMQNVGCGVIVGRGFVPAQPPLIHSQASSSHHPGPLQTPSLSCRCPGCPDSSGLCWWSSAAAPAL